MTKNFFGQTLTILLAAIISLLPQIANAASTPMPPAETKSPSSACPNRGLIQESKEQLRPGGVIDDYGLDMVTRSTAVRLQNHETVVQSGMQFSPDFHDVTLTLGVGLDVRSVTVPVDNMTFEDLKPLADFVQEVNAHDPAGSALLAEYQCRMTEQYGSDPHEALRNMQKQLRHMGISVPKDVNPIQTVAAMMRADQDEQTLAANSSSPPDDFLPLWAVACIVMCGPLAYFGAMCGACSYGCGNCFCC